MVFFLLTLMVIMFTIDLFKMNKKNGKFLGVYATIVIIAVLVVLVDEYGFFAKSPLELWIEKMEPITNWVDTIFN